MNKQLRFKLTKIIEGEGDKNWWNPKEFEEVVRSQIPQQLNIVSVPPSPSGNYNCFVYAFGLENDPEFLGGNNPTQKEFIRYLLNRNILKISEKSSKGDLIFYEDAEETITHGGIMQDDKTILSKWMWGALFMHDVWDVPSSFGDKVFYCKPLSPQTTKDNYIIYRNSGVKIDPIS